MTVSSSASSPPAEVLDSDFAGWVFFDDGTDFPLRLHRRGDSETIALSLSLPAQGTYDVSVTGAVLADGRYEVARLSAKGQRVALLGGREAGAFRGQFTIDGEALGRFELMPSRRPLIAAKPALPLRAPGVYRATSGESLLVGTWPWGEPRLLDLETGGDRTLFAVTKDEWIAGPSLYVPSPEQASLTFRPDGSIDLRRHGGAKDVAERVYSRVDLRDEEISFRSNGTTLQGTLTTTTGPGPHPLVIILGGSDVTLRSHVRRSVEIFAGLGVAAFTYDLRGYGASGGAGANAIATSAQDACAAAEELGKRGDIDARRIGIFGSSRGGWLGPAAAARCGGSISFLVLFAAPAISPKDQLTRYRLERFRRAGHGAAELAEAAAYLDLVWRSVDSDEDWVRYELARERIVSRGWLDILQGPSSRDSDDHVWQRLNQTYDPIPALTRTQAPLLAVYGEFDLVVDPDDNTARMRQALERAGNRDLTIATMRGADHGLYLVDPARPFDDLPIHRVLGYEPSVWRVVRRWLTDHRIVH